MNHQADTDDANTPGAADPQAMYEEMLSGFQQIVGMELVPALAIYDSIRRRLERDGEAALKQEPLLLYIHKAMEVDVFLMLSKLLDGKRSERNIVRFNAFCESNQKNITWHGRRGSAPGVTMASLVKKHGAMLDGHAVVIDRLKTRRDKYLAHADKKYFLNLEQLDRDFPVATKDLVDIVQCFQVILSDHSMALSSSATISVDGFVYIASDNFLNKLLR